MRLKLTRPTKLSDILLLLLVTTAVLSSVSAVDEHVQFSAALAASKAQCAECWLLNVHHALL